MENLRICVNSQTPLVQFTSTSAPGRPARALGKSTDLASLIEGIDYRYSPGGVTRMVLPLLRRLLEERTVAEAHWVSLNPSGPSTVRLPGLTLHNVALPAPRMARYGETKEVIWGTVHGTGRSSGASEMFWTDDFTEYGYYNRRTAELIRALDREHDFDLFYIHDFQQLPIGSMLDTLKPKVLRWHIPFDATLIPPDWRPRLGAYLASYDAVVVSTRRYLTELRKFGYKGRAVRMYPYIDPMLYSRPTVSEAWATGKHFGLSDEDEVILIVGRMDPMKGQDRALRAFARIRRRFPHLRLVLVGNGSFSGSDKGLALGKSDRWRAGLEALAKKLRIADRVVFTGHVSQPELDALYERSLFTILPSVQEGFGLVVVESWIHSRAALITEAAGVAELVRPGRNGILYDPEDIQSLADRMAELAADPERCQKIGRAGRRTAKQCTLSEAVTSERTLLAQLIEV